MSWSWEANTWRKPIKLLLLLATVWPLIYMVLFMGVVISLVFFAERNRNPCGQIDVLELDKKIRDGEIRKLSLTPGSIVATSATNNCTYELFVRNESSREEILKHARETVDGRPRVGEIKEEASTNSDLPEPFSTILPLGFVVLMILHFATILLMTAQMPFYIVLAVKNTSLEQGIKIMWIVLFALLSIFACPVYWYLNIWRKPKSALTGPADGSVVGSPA